MVRPLLVECARTAAVVSGLLGVYWLLPVRDGIGWGWVLRLVGGLLITCAVLGWQLWSIRRSAHPLVRAVRGLVVSLAIFVLAFATTYPGVSHGRPAAFSEPLDKVGALYFTATVVTTVGFGDVVPRDDLTRALATGQMLLDLVFLAVTGRLLVTTAIRRRE